MKGPRATGRAQRQEHLPAPLLLDLADPVIAAHLAVAIANHRELMRRRHDWSPPELKELEEKFRSRAQRTWPADEAGAVELRRPPRLVVTVQEAAEMLAISPSSVKRLMVSGELASVRLGSQRRISIAALVTLREDSAGSAQVSEAQGGPIVADGVDGGEGEVQ